MINFEKIKNLKFSEKIAFFRFKKIDKQKYLITNDIGNFCFLKNENFLNFIYWDLEKIDKQKYQELKDKLFIKDEKFNKNLIEKYRYKNAFLKQWPSLHIIVLTVRCDHTCRYCHAYVSWEKAKWKDLTKDKAKKIVDTIFYSPSNDITIEFQGWEPLLNFEILKFIIEYAKTKAYYLNKNVRFSLVSNLSLMDEEKLEYLINNRVSVCTSLDGDEEIHNFNRLHSKWNSFKKVAYWIKNINQEYKNQWLNMKIGGLTTVTKKTLDKYQELIDTYVDLWFDSIFIRPLNPYWFANKNWEKIWYSFEDFNKFYNNAINYILKLNLQWFWLKENLITIYLEKIFKQLDPNFLDERSPCGACVWQVAYNYNGKIYTCDEGRMFWEMGDDNFCVWNLLNGSPKESYIGMFDSEVTKSMMKASVTDSLPWYNHDVYKPYIWVCPIYNYKKFWNIFWKYLLDNKLNIDYNIIEFIFKSLEDKEKIKIFKNWLKEIDVNNKTNINYDYLK